MTNKDKTMSIKHGARFPRIAVAVLAILLAGGLIWRFFPASPPSTEAATPAGPQKAVTPTKPPRAQPPVYAYTRPTTLAVAQRRGRCRAMNYHLTQLAQAKNKNDVETELKFLGLLAGEMMNGYPQQAVDDSGSNALPVVYTPEGQRDLSEARDSMRETVRSSRGVDGKEAARRVAENCMACHARFTRNGGKALPPLGKVSSGD